MRKLLVTCTVIALGAFGSGAALAQYAPTPGASPSQDQPGTPPGQQNMPSDQQMSPPSQNPTQSASPTQGQSTATDLTGQMIYSSTGRKIGTVSSMTVDAQGQQQAVVDVERYLGMGGKNILMPVSSLQARAKGGYATTLGASEIKKLPEYKAGGPQQ
jgi:sporulation protein YlmC with PRC-barrel domain